METVKLTKRIRYTLFSLWYKDWRRAWWWILPRNRQNVIHEDNIIQVIQNLKEKIRDK